MTSRFPLFALLALLVVSAGCGDDDGTTAATLSDPDVEAMDDFDRFTYFAGFEAAQTMKMDSAAFKFFDFGTFEEGFDDGASMDSSRLAYIRGYQMGGSFSADTTSGIDRDIFLRGFRSGLTRDSSDLSEGQLMRLSTIAQDTMSVRQLRAMARTDTSMARMLREVTVAGAESRRFLAEVEERDGIVETESGLLYSVDEAGDGQVLDNPSDIVRINYTGRLPDGTVFDSSTDGTVTNPANQFVPGFNEGLLGMRVGGKRTLYIPSRMGYGLQGRPGIPPNSALVFEVELLEITSRPPGTMQLPGQGMPRR